MHRVFVGMLKRYIPVALEQGSQSEIIKRNIISARLQLLAFTDLLNFYTVRRSTDSLLFFPSQNTAYVVIFHIFHRGLQFKLESENAPHQMVPTRLGGTTAWHVVKSRNSVGISGCKSTVQFISKIVPSLCIGSMKGHHDRVTR